MKAVILIIDDETQMRKLLRMTLELEGYSVHEAATGAEGIAKAADASPDLVLLDLGLPDRSGHDILKHLREWFTRPVIIVSVENSTDDIVRALDSGANDYLTKPFQPEELTARIRAAVRSLRRDQNVPIVDFGDVTVDFAARIVKKNNLPVKLTLTEYRLLSLLIQNESKVLTHQFLLSQVWGPENQNDLQYLRVFVGNLRRKIEDDHNKPAHILTESGVGYRFIGKAETI